ncbi:MAG: MFS transporter, partial [Anaerolineae bacterium]|nr:MFS transporter [Anaerolineae bacterium]
MNRYVALLRSNRDYRYLWLGAVSSNFGDWFNLIASAELISDLTSSGIAVSYLFLARFIPLFVVSPFAGVLADKYNRRHLMIIADVLRALTVAGFLLIDSPDQLWLFYTLMVTQFVLSAVFTPARNAALANYVAQEDLVTANAIDSATWSSMLALGALIGGIVAQYFGRNSAFLFDATTFLLSAWFISRTMPLRRPRLASAAGSEHEKIAFSDGLRFLWSRPFIMTLVFVKAGGSLAWGAINVLEINYASDVFPIGGDGATTLGLIYFVTGVGTGLGPIAIRHWLGDAPRRLRLGITLGYLLLTLGIAMLALAPTLPLYLLGTLTRTVGTGALWVFASALLYLLLPDEVRGRVFAFEFALLTLTQSLSTLWAGIALDNVGLTLQQTTLTMALVAAVVMLLWIWANAVWSRGMRPEAASRV